jgi:hypothetical protein
MIQRSEKTVVHPKRVPPIIKLPVTSDAPKIDRSAQAANRRATPQRIETTLRKNMATPNNSTTKSRKSLELEASS